MDYTFRIYENDIAKWIDKKVVSIESIPGGYVLKTGMGKVATKPTILWAAATLMYEEHMESEISTQEEKADG